MVTQGSGEIVRAEGFRSRTVQNIRGILSGEGTEDSDASLGAVEFRLISLSSDWISRRGVQVLDVIVGIRFRDGRITKAAVTGRRFVIIIIRACVGLLESEPPIWPSAAEAEPNFFQKPVYPD